MILKLVNPSPLETLCCRWMVPSGSFCKLRTSSENMHNHRHAKFSSQHLFCCIVNWLPLNKQHLKKHLLISLLYLLKIYVPKINTHYISKSKFFSQLNFKERVIIFTLNKSWNCVKIFDKLLCIAFLIYNFFLLFDF